MILGVTPARSGSRGIPRKNLHLLCGKPLMAWTIEAAKAARRLDRYVVSTEDSEIAHVARQWGGEVLPRPPELAQDDTPTLPVLQHVLTQVPAEVVVVLQATSPIRDPDLIDRCIERFLETGADSLATGFICKETEYGTNHVPRQAIPGFFANDGNVYVIRAEILRRGDRYGTHIERVLIDREQNVQIDDEFDLWVAEQVLRKRHQEPPHV